MAHIVLGIGTSHTPMLNAPLQDWPRFIDRDQHRQYIELGGQPMSYAQLLARAPKEIASQLEPQILADRYARAQAEVEQLGQTLRAAQLDALIIVGDDQKELYHDDNMPSILIYRGQTIRNTPLTEHPGPDWARAASALYYEPQVPREYPVHLDLANHLVECLMAHEFDLSVADRIAQGKGEGHAFGFVHRRLLLGSNLPVVPIFLNTYYPPNQPSPARCYKFGQAIAAAVQAWPGDARVGIIASGGLSHFLVDEPLDQRVMDALRQQDEAAIAAIPRNKLNSGNSEIRNWICMAGAARHLSLQKMSYIPAYRTAAGTGTGLCFASWQ